MENKSYRLLRPRTLVYTGILSLLLVSLVSTIALRKPVILDVIRDRNTLYRDVGRQGIENNYTLRVINKQNTQHDYQLSVSGISGMQIRTETSIALDGESVLTLPVSIVVPHEQAAGGQVIEFRLESTDGSNIVITEESRFRGPIERR